MLTAYTESPCVLISDNGDDAVVPNRQVHEGNTQREAGPPIAGKRPLGGAVSVAELALGRSDPPMRPRLPARHRRYR